MNPKRSTAKPRAKKRSTTIPPIETTVAQTRAARARSTRHESGLSLKVEGSFSIGKTVPIQDRPFFVTANRLKLAAGNFVKIRAGYPTSAWLELSEHIAMTPVNLLENLGVSRSTAMRRSHETHLKPQESEKVYQVAKVVSLADEVFGDHNKSRIWLYAANRALSGDSPFSRLDTAAGADEVTQLLERISYGVYS